MNRKIHLPLVVGVFIFFVLTLAVQPAPVHASNLDNACSDIETVFARGSGNGAAYDEASQKFNTSINTLLAGKEISYNKYDLGTEKYDNAQYPHVEISFTVGVGAYASGGENFKYGASVDEGVKELKAYLKARVNKCGDGSAYVLAGYSQGAQVVGDTLPQLSKDIRDKISYVALFADPKLDLPEANQYSVYENYLESGGSYEDEYGSPMPRIPDACYGANLSPWRHTIDNCDKTWHGILGPREPYTTDDMRDRVNLWCIDHDVMCGSSPLIPYNNSGHETHYVEDRAIPTAAKEALAAIASQKPVLRPKLAVDTEIAKQSLSSAAKYDVAVIRSAYCFVGDLPGDVDIYRKIYDSAGVPGNQFVGYGDFPYYTGLTFDGTPGPAVRLLPYAPWRSDAQKLIYVLSEPWCRVRYDNRDKLVRYGAATLQSAEASLTTTSLNSNPIIVLLTTPEAYSQATAFAQNYSNYYVAPYSYHDLNIGDIPSPANIIMQTVYEPVFSTNEYRPLVGQPLTLSLNPSSLSAAITNYAWDFNNDGITDQETTTPYAAHTYSAPYDSIARVRMSDASGAQGTTTTHIATATSTHYASRNAITAPTQVSITKLSDSSARVDWAAVNSEVDSWMIRIGGYPVGRAEKDSRTVTLTDLEFDNPLTVSVSGLSADGTEGDPTSATIEPGLTTETPSLARQGNAVYALITEQDQERYNKPNQNTPDQAATEKKEPKLTTSPVSKSSTKSTQQKNTLVHPNILPLVIGGVFLFVNVIFGATVLVVRHMRKPYSVK